MPKPAQPLLFNFEPHPPVKSKLAGSDVFVLFRPAKLAHFEAKVLKERWTKLFSGPLGS